MNYHDSPEEAEFRAALRRWLAGNIPGDEPPEGDEEARATFLSAWHRRLYAGGWLGLTWPVEAGGRGLSPIYEGIFNEELGAANAPSPPGNIGFLGKAIIGFGSPEQQKRYLPTLLKGEERWCQGFSEPGAGSDLGSLRTRADLDGDHYVVNGQKVWTSFAKWADWCLLLARTDQEAPKHKGISALVLRMDSPGVSVRPIHQIDHSNDLAEVFFDDVQVPVDQLIGAPGQGWSIAMRTLAYERGPADIGFIARARRRLHQLETEAGRGAFGDDPAVGVRLAQCYVHIEMLRLHVLRSLSQRVAQGEPGPEGSADKLLWTLAEQELSRLALDLAGVSPILGDDLAPLHEYFQSRAVSIYGGSAQIQRSIIAQRVLGMPRS
ncbi:MAG TPA: acyl-CoA dehydrogenase family protein [Acidimicrobiales bacterium]|nr:acyl-CoA dehydrogenase family protein [Acidimicrobiales bacterium]